MQIFNEVLFFQATYNLKTEKQSIHLGYANKLSELIYKS